ncbi:MAG: peptide chain release factor N(5)-glutamine methyltransferase, partial [Akkermansiaceae bacterium]|nr:peptide chain release factor N(5)-glutamine methyltransferase [Akkermansiaceae bacterium]
RVEALAGRLVDGEPLQYVEGFTSFRGYRLACDRRALVPRPETEQLVEAALAFEPAWRTGRPRMADVGTGSGCIAVAMACSHPRVIVHASDVSGEALELARVNVQRHGLADRVRLVQSDLLDACEAGSLDLVISNPPYVASAALAALPAEVRLYEPVQALDGGSDGLHVLRRLVPRAREKLRPGGALFVEIGEQQGRAVRLLMETHGFGHVRVQQDLAGRDRIARGVIT